MANRKCEHWLKSFLEWTMPRSIAPESYLIFSGLFALSSGIRRHVKVGKEYLGGWECYPHLYIMFNAPAGVATKSTTIDRAVDLLTQVPSLTQLSGSFSTPIIANKIKESTDSSIYVIGSELGQIIEKAGNSIYSVLIDLFDGKKRLEDETISRGLVFADNPSVNLFTATTPEWIADNMSAGLLGGGFGSRILAIHEEAPRNYRLIYKDITADIDFESLERDLVEDLAHIAGNIYGQFQMEKPTYEWFEDWYQKHAIAKSDTERKIKGYVQRRPAYVMKIAMLWSIAYKDELVLTKQDLEYGINLLKSIEKNIATTYKYVGKASYVADIEGIEKYVRDMCKQNGSGKILYSTVFEEFKSSADPEMLKSLILANVTMDNIELFIEEEQTWIRPMKVRV